MKRHLILLGVCFVFFLLPGLLHAQAPSGVSVTCDDGSTFDNGVEVQVSQMRAGFTYTATAIGLNGFDPVLAVLDSSTGSGLCSDDDSDAADYSAVLPTTGSVSSSNLSAQVDFNQISGNTFADISLVVGGYGNQSGEFILILEGMAATASDNGGDTFSINLTPGMVASGVPLSIYMLARDTSLDPTIYRVDGDLNSVTDNNGNTIGCDDAGNADLCWGESVDLSDSSVTISAGRLPGGPFDSMLTLPISSVALNDDPTLNYFNFIMTSSPQNTTEGQYVLAFHIGMTEASGGGKESFSSGGEESQGNSQGAPTPVPQNSTNNVGTGVSVTCDSGSSFDNGVEVLVANMARNVTYTATVIGLNGFDPVLAVLDATTGEGFCSDDEAGASEYAADLPTTGAVAASDLSAQLEFTQDTGSALADMSLVVGGYGNQGGEFVLILEGMSASSDDEGGDIVNVNITPGMVASGVPLTLYMIANTEDLDSYLVKTDASLTPSTDSSGDTIGCDDAGSDNLCWGSSVDLSDSSVTLAGRDLAGWQYDSMLSLDLSGLRLNSDMSQNYYVFLAGTSPHNETEGDYVLVIHAGQSD